MAQLLFVRQVRSTFSSRARVSSRVPGCQPPGSQLGSKTTIWPRSRRHRAYGTAVAGENRGSR